MQNQIRTPSPAIQHEQSSNAAWSHNGTIPTTRRRRVWLLGCCVWQPAMQVGQVTDHGEMQPAQCGAGRGQRHAVNGRRVQLQRDGSSTRRPRWHVKDPSAQEVVPGRCGRWAGARGGGEGGHGWEGLYINNNSREGGGVLCWVEGGSALLCIFMRMHHSSTQHIHSSTQHIHSSTQHHTTPPHSITTRTLGCQQWDQGGWAPGPVLTWS